MFHREHTGAATGRPGGACKQRERERQPTIFQGGAA
jgi:hypothetical protein